MKKMICVAYFTGATGQSLGLFYFGKGVVAGADVGGLAYDGTLKEQQDGSYSGAVTLKVPAGTSLITGMMAGSAAQEVTAQVRLPKNFAHSGEVVRIETPAGPVAARFEFLREVA